MLKYLISFCFIYICTLQAAEIIPLRGYGTVTADFQADRTAFTCENRDKAEILYAKLFRDMTLMGVRPLKVEVCQGIPVLSGEAGKSAAIGLKGNTVVILESGNKESLLRNKALPELEFPEFKKYPVFFDYYDLRALKFYKSAMTSFLNYGLENQWPFAKKHNIEGFVLHTNFAVGAMPAEGFFNFTATDYELERARQADGAITFCATFGGALSLWAYNLDPGSTAKVQTSTVVSEWQHGVEAGTYESYGSAADPEHSPLRAYQMKIMENYRNHPNLGGWQLYCGAPIGDQLGMGMAGVLWDSSAGAQKTFREWLKQHFSLRELGKRWKGDENAYKS
ncbi:MAG: hypothetical protein WC637_03805, partial [Victivallales bacterium]